MVLVYELFRPVPPPFVRVSPTGEGKGLVLSIPDGIRCGANCRGEFELGQRVKLIATVAEGSTFEGWAGECDPVLLEKDPLACEVVVSEKTPVEARFGLVPNEVEVELQEDSPALARNTLKLRELEPNIQAKVERQPEMLPAPAPVPDKPIPEQEQLKSVEVPDDNEVKNAPDDAKFLSDKNRNVLEETRARETNLDRQSEGEVASSSPNDNKSNKVGGEKAVIAELEKMESQEQKSRGQEGESAAIPKGDAGSEGAEKESGGVLSMRGIEGMGVPGKSEFEPDRLTPDAGGKQGKPGLKTSLSLEDYERIVGPDALAAELDVGKRQLSQKQGRWEKKLGAIRSSLENFTPEVRPGNQTALKTRAAPFAVYIARMHRRIHELWGFGFLIALEGKPSNLDMNRRDLVTKVEIVINPDGTIAKTTIVSGSGVLAFDVAALDAIHSSAPFEPVPDAIRSADGKAYVHWSLHRDERQCGTFGAEPFILDKPRDRGP
jgi:TonB family protein